jgi:hypothetical protein
MAAVTGAATTQEAKIVIKTREDAAEVLADEIAQLIVREMKKNDTHNGYKEDNKQ